MAQPEPKKRELKFDDFDAMLADIRMLREQGYVSNGKWTLGQVCGHLTDWMRFPMDGFPKPPLFMRVIFWMMKYTVAPGMKRKILAEGFKGGMPTMPETVPKSEEVSDEQGIKKLEDIVQQISSHTGDLYPSPLFGPMDEEMHTKVSLLHAEHHLGYLELKQV